MSKLQKLFDMKAIILNLKATTKAAALKEIATFLAKNKFVENAEKHLQHLKDREKQFSTGIGDNIAIPHTQNQFVKKDVVLIARSKKGIAWKSTDNKPVHVIFSIALNSKNAATQTDVLQELSAIMMNKTLVKKIADAKSIEEILKLVNQKETKKSSITKGSKKVIAIAACPTGIAHTYMAADSIKNAAEEMGMQVKVETQGRAIDNRLTRQDIDSADVIIFAVDKAIEDMGRFNNKKVIKTTTKNAIKQSKKLIKDGIEGRGEIIKTKASSNESIGEISWAPFKNVYKNLMGGVSRMLPFVVAGGILIGLAFLFDSGITGGNLGVTRDISRWFAGLGKTVFGIFVPVLGAYVAYSIVGAEGLMPGFAAGLIASGGGILYSGDATVYLDSGQKTAEGAKLFYSALQPVATGWANLWGHLTPGIDQGVLSAGSGFIGAMAGGYIAAAVVVVLRKYVFANVSRTFQGIVSIIGVPLLSLLGTGAIMFVAQIPMVYFAFGLQEGLRGLANHDLLFLIGIIVGLMMAADMGGPINKAAYVFATGNLATTGANAISSQEIMHAVMIAGMTPPLVIAFSTAVFGEKAYSRDEKEAGLTNWLMGAFFITEGAIPFAAKDPKRVIPVIMFASAISGGIVAAFQIGVTAPHGGVFVFALLKSHLFNSNGLQVGLGVAFSIGALLIGTVIGGTALGLWKSRAVKAGKLVLA